VANFGQCASWVGRAPAWAVEEFFERICMPASLWKHWRLGGLGLLLCLSLGAAARAVEGHTYDEQLALDGKALLLNGAGVRSVAWFKGFTVGLWVGQRSGDAELLMSQEGPKRLRMALLVDNISSEELVKALHGGVIKRVGPSESERMGPRLELLAKQIRALGTFRNNDVIDLDYLPASGLQLRLNGVKRGEPIPGADLYAAILSIYIGEQPVDKKLKPALLGASGA
jgi:hypothetical protein